MRLEILNDSISDGSTTWTQAQLEQKGIYAPYIVIQTEDHLIVNGIKLRGHEVTSAEDETCSGCALISIGLAVLIAWGVML